MEGESAAQPACSIVLRAPDGELGWTIVELQGTLVKIAGGSLDGMRAGLFYHEPQARNPPILAPHGTWMRAPCNEVRALS